MIAQIKDWNEDCVKISAAYLLYFLRNKSSNSVTDGSGRAGLSRSIVLNDSTGPKMVIKLYFNFSYFFKVLELTECRLGDPYMTGNKNFVPDCHIRKI